MGNPFVVGSVYTRDDVYRVMNVPEPRRKGNWETGYNRFEDDLFIFANVGSAGRSGHDYANHWIGDELAWEAKNGTTIEQPQIRWMLNPTGKVFLFTRENDRAPFTFEGLATAVKVENTTPVSIRWRVTGLRLPLSEDEKNDYSIETRRAEVKLRIKQSVFRQRVLENFEGKCCLSNISESDMLVASHITPWKDRVDSRLDPRNGLCLSRSYDALFDNGYISFLDNLQVIVTPRIDELSLALQLEIQSLSGRVAHQPVRYPILSDFLSFHREMILKS